MGESSSSWPRASSALEAAVLDLLSGGWDEDRRLRAHEMAVALTQAAKMAGRWETEAVLRPLCSLLTLSSQEMLSIRQAVREKLLELLGLLKSHHASRSA
jgi:hypothetical protein